MLALPSLTHPSPFHYPTHSPSPSPDAYPSPLPLPPGPPRNVNTEFFFLSLPLSSISFFLPGTPSGLHRGSTIDHIASPNSKTKANKRQKTDSSDKKHQVIQGPRREMGSVETKADRDAQRAEDFGNARADESAECPIIYFTAYFASR